MSEQINFNEEEQHEQLSLEISTKKRQVRREATLSPEPELSARQVLLSTYEAIHLEDSFINPFRDRHKWMTHLRPEWLDEQKTGVRLRMHNRGWEPGRDYLTGRPYCLGLAAIRHDGQLRFFGEMHYPRPKSEPYRLGMEFSPHDRRLIVTYPLTARNRLGEPLSADLVREDEAQRLILVDFMHTVNTVIPNIVPMYLKPYKPPANRTHMQGSYFKIFPCFTMPAQGRVNVRDAEQGQRLGKIIYRRKDGLE